MHQHQQFADAARVAGQIDTEFTLDLNQQVTRQRRIVTQADAIDNVRRLAHNLDLLFAAIAALGADELATLHAIVVKLTG